MQRGTNAAPQGKRVPKTRLAPVVPMIYICFKYSIIGSFLREKVAKTYSLAPKCSITKRGCPPGLPPLFCRCCLQIFSSFFIRA